MSDETMATEEEPEGDTTEEVVTEEEPEGDTTEENPEVAVKTVSQADALLSYLKECVENGHVIVVRDRSGQGIIIDIENF